MPEFPRLVPRDGVEVVPIPDEKFPEIGQRLADGPLPANDQAPPSKYFSGRALSEFVRVWDDMKSK
jgi:hypothetical protein